MDDDIYASVVWEPVESLPDPNATLPYQTHKGLLLFVGGWICFLALIAKTGPKSEAAYPLSVLDDRPMTPGSVHSAQVRCSCLYGQTALLCFREKDGLMRAMVLRFVSMPPTVAPGPAGLTVSVPLKGAPDETSEYIFQFWEFPWLDHDTPPATLE